MADTALQTVRHEIAQVNGADAHYTRAGRAGSPLVLVHGGAGNRHDWAKNIKALSKTHQVYAPDLLGYGQNFRDDTPHTVRRFSDFLGDFMDAVGLRSASLVGHSLGARVCLELAQRDPHRVDRLVLAAPIGFGRLSVPGYILGTLGWALSKLARRRLPYPPLDIELNERSHEHLRTVTAPSLVVWGRWDLFFPHRYAIRVVETIPNSSLCVFPRSGHAPHRNEPSAFNAAVLTFLSSGLSSGGANPQG